MTSMTENLGVGPIPFDQFRAELLSLYQPPMRAKKTYAQIRRTLETLAGMIGTGTTAELTPALIARFIAARPAGESTHTTRSVLNNVRTVCSYAAQMGYIRTSPFQFRKQWIRVGPPKPRQHHSMEEIARVLALMARDVERKTGWAQWRARRLQALASVVAYTGMRKMEAIGLMVEDILLDERLILIVPRDGNRLKTVKSAQPVPIPEALAPILADWLPRTGCVWAFPNSTHSNPWVGGSPGYKPLDRMRRLGKRAGVEDFTFLSLRHSWATHAEYWGLSDTMIQRVLRHTSVRTQGHYRHADSANIRAATRGIDFGAIEPGEVR